MTTAVPSASYSLTVRLEIENKPGMLGKVTTAIGEMGGDIGSIDIAEASTEVIVRDFRVYCIDERERAPHGVPRCHHRGGGGIDWFSYTFFRTAPSWCTGRQDRDPQQGAHPDARDLSMVYTPGVSRVCLAIDKDPELAYTLTIKRNTVAVVTDGTAVLGLGDIGPRGGHAGHGGQGHALQGVRRGRRLADLPGDARTRTRSWTIVQAHRARFGGINLEDISAPRCFDIEERLKAARHPGLSRRPARHRRGGAGRADQRAALVKQGPEALQVVCQRRRRGGHRRWRRS